jgi:hypothetical protein
MLTHQRKPMCLSLMAFDLPVWSIIETSGTLYQRDRDRFHLLLTEPLTEDQQSPLMHPSVTDNHLSQTPRLLWLEISPYRVIMTMQGNGKFSYRHFWEQGVYGLSRYWLQDESRGANEQLRLRNFTRELTVVGNETPVLMRVEYELWSGKLQLGRYVLNLEVYE